MRLPHILNVRVAHIRPHGYNNLREWMADEENLYIGRAGVVFVEGRRFPPEASTPTLFASGSTGGSPCRNTGIT